jgi:hypothetical protein
MGMRKLSQEVFALFKRTYIDSQRNFLLEVNDAPVEEFLGIAFTKFIEEASRAPRLEPGGNTIAQGVASARSAVKSFVIFQLSNSLPPNGSGVGCGHYDEHGVDDNGGIAKVMNDYVFHTCFNPEIHQNNVLLFLDHCLSHLSSSFFSGRDEGGYIATKAELPGGLDSEEMGRYWRRHREYIRGLDLRTSGRSVFTRNYIAVYSDDLDNVFAVLDELSVDTSTTELEPAAE